MSLQSATNGGSEQSEGTESDGESLSFPALTVEGHGIAERRQQVGDGAQTDCIETVEVRLSVTHVIHSLSEWTDLINPTYRPHKRTVEVGSLVDRLLAQLDGDGVYTRPSSASREATHWEVTVEAPAPAWKRLMMAFIVREGRESHDRAYDAVTYLDQLLGADIANAGAALAALDLISQYDLDYSTEPFLEHVESA